MLSRKWNWLGASLLALALGSFTVLAGCGDAEDTDVDDDDVVSTEGTGDDDDAVEEVDNEIEEALASLSDEDRASVESQEICPVSEDALGSMGTPEKVSVDGRDVWICCEGCKEPLLENPEEYMANIDG